MNLLKYKLHFSIFLIWLFQISGIIGILAGFEDWFVSLTPLNLSICFILVVWNIQKLNYQDIIALGFPLVIGLIAEMLGVNYGLIFGNYTYGENLGFKIFGVPFMIGINWVVLTYATAAISKRITKNYWLSLVLASLLMVLLDLAIEVSAPRFDFWEFDNGYVPLQNYIGWLGTAFVAHLFFQKFFNKGNIRLAINLYLAFGLFFLIFVIFK